MKNTDERKIFVITNPMPLHNNSPAISLGKFIQVMLQAGYVPCVVGARIPADGIPGVPESVSVKNFGYGGKSVIKILSFIFLQIRMFFWCIVNCRKGDAVYFWIADKMIGAFLGAKLMGAEINYFLYGRVFGDGKGGFSEKLVLYMMHRADFVCSESPSVLDQWEIPVGKKHDCINLFVPDLGVAPVPFDKRDNTVAMYCRLSIGKHINDAIAAFCKIHELFPEYKLKIIGGGAIEDEMRRFAAEKDAGEFVTFTGWLPHEQALKEIAGAKILLYPTDAEGVPGGVLESMALGVVPLASAVGGIPDIIEQGVDGVFLSGADEGAIADDLCRLMTSDGLCEMSAAAVVKIRDKYSLRAASENFKAVRESHK